MLFLELDMTNKKCLNKKVLDLDFDTGNNKEYKVKTIWDNAVYISKVKGYLRGFYYLVAWKSYPKEENI